MNEVAIDYREKVAQLEAALLNRPRLDVDSLTTHHFATGIYVRELMIPAGHVCVGKIHRREHLNILLKGTILVSTEEGVEQLTGPCVIKSPAGVKRSGYAVTDTIWLTVHDNHDDERDLVKLEEKYIAPSFAALEADEVRELT